MYVTEMLQGRPYQCFIPVPMVPSLSKESISICRRWDNVLSQSLNGEKFNGDLAHAVAQLENRLNNEDRILHVRTGIEKWMSQRSLNVEKIIEINSALRGAKSAGFRQGPVWMGGPHPADSWHVGAPPARLKGLVKQLLSQQDSTYPTIAWAFISMLRILQIHPFADGNGRTARFYFLWLIHRKIGPSVEAISIINYLFDRKVMDINSLSKDMQASGFIDMDLQRLAEFFMSTRDGLEQVASGR